MKAKLADELGQPVLTRPIEVRIARTPEDMTALAPKEIPPPSYASAVALPGLRLIILSMRAPVSDEGTDLGELFRHELAHIALDDATGSKHVPFWFNEGYAVHASNERAMDRAETLSNASLWKTILPLSDLDRSAPVERYEVSVAYAESADFLRFLLRQADRGRFASLIERTRKGQPFEHALGDAYASDQRKLEYEWREELAKRYTFWPVLLSGSAIWVLVIGALGVGFVRKKQRDKVVVARWEREEREDAEEAARRAAIRAAIQTGIRRPPRPKACVPSSPRWSTTATGTRCTDGPTFFGTLLTSPTSGVEKADVGPGDSHMRCGRPPHRMWAIQARVRRFSPSSVEPNAMRPAKRVIACGARQRRPATKARRPAAFD